MVADGAIEEIPGDAGMSTSYRLADGVYEVLERARLAEEPVAHVLQGQSLVEVEAETHETSTAF